MGVSFLKIVFICIQSYLILTTSSVSGLPFSSISSITSLKSSAESLSNEDSSPLSPAIVNLIPTSSETSTSTLVSASPGNFKLLISSPNVINFDLSLDSSPSRDFTFNSEETYYEFRGIPKTTLFLSPIAQTDNLSPTDFFKSSSELDSSSNDILSLNLPTSSLESTFGTTSKLDIDFSLADSKREARNTKFVLRPFTNNLISGNSETSNNDCGCESTAAPFVGFPQSNFFNNSCLQSSKTFSSFPSGFLPNPFTSPCLKVPINLAISPPLSSIDSNLQSDKSPVDFSQSNTLTSSIFNTRPVLNENTCNFFQSELFSPQKSTSQVINIDNFIPLFSNTTNSLYSFNKPLTQSNIISNSAVQSSNQFKNIYFTSQDSSSSNIGSDNSINSFENIDSSSESPFTGSQNFKSFLSDTRPITVQFPTKSVNVQKIPQIECNTLPNQVCQVNNNFINSRDVANNINNIIPFTFKTNPQTSTLNHNNNEGCPQSETVTLNNNIVIIPNNNNIYPSNNLKLSIQNNNDQNNPETKLNRDDRLERLKSSINAYNNLKTMSSWGQNSNQGCPQLISIPFHKPTLNVADSTKDLDSKISIQTSCIEQKPQIVNNQNLNIAFSKLNHLKALSQNQNNQGCPQLSIQPQKIIIASQNNLANVDDSIKNENYENFKIKNSNNLGCPQVIPTTYIDTSSPQKIGNVATFTLNDNKINTANTKPISNLESVQVKSTHYNNNNKFILQIPKNQVVNNLPSQNNEFTSQPKNNNMVIIPNLAIKLTDSCNMKTPESPLSLISPTNILTSQNTPNDNVHSIKLEPSLQNIGSGPGSNNFFTLQNVSSKYFTSTTFNPFSYIPLEGNKGTLNNSPLSLLNSASPCVYNVAPRVPTVSLLNLTPSVPNIPQTSFSNTEMYANQPLAINQNSCYSNNNLQNLLTLQNRNINNPSSLNNVLNSNFLPASSFQPVQSLPQVSFVNSVPSPINVPPITFSLSGDQNFLSTPSNLPIVCTSPLTSYTSYQPIITPCTINPILSALLPQVSLRSSHLYSSLNSLVSELTQNIMSTVISKTSPSSPSNLPPVNTYTLISECKPDDSLCLDISESLAPYFISSSSSSPRLSLPEIPIACNEYLPPLSNSQIIPINSEICLSSAEPYFYDAFTPFSWPITSYNMMPSVSDSTVYILPSF